MGLHSIFSNEIEHASCCRLDRTRSVEEKREEEIATSHLSSLNYPAPSTRCVCFGHFIRIDRLGEPTCSWIDGRREDPTSRQVVVLVSPFPVLSALGSRLSLLGPLAPPPPAGSGDCSGLTSRPCRIYAGKSEGCRSKVQSSNPATQRVRSTDARTRPKFST